MRDRLRLRRCEPCRAPEYGIARLLIENQLAVPGDGGRSAAQDHSWPKQHNWNEVSSTRTL